MARLPNSPVRPQPPEPVIKAEIVHKLDPQLHEDLHRFLTAYEKSVNVPTDPAIERTLTALLNSLQTMNSKVEHIMSAISDFAGKVTAHQDKMDSAIAGLQGDVQALNDKITELQNTQGAITPEDQALLDAIEARGSAISEKLDALDSLTPPATPPG